GYLVKVFTARLGGNEDRDKLQRLIRAYTKKHIGIALESTNEKDPGLIAIWDDKAREVEKNTGEFLDKPQQVPGMSFKEAAPKSIWYHGTSIKNLKSIMSQGLVPEGTEKVWADDPDAGLSAPSRQSYGGCYDDPTSILTKQRGFQHFYDLLPDDEVATLVDGRELVYEKPLAFTRYWYEGPMYAFKTRLIDQLITPDHKVYWRNRISNVKRLQLGQSETDFQLSEVSSLIGSAEVKSCGLGRNREYIQKSWRHVEFKRSAEWHCASAPALFEVPPTSQWAIPVKKRRRKFAE